MWQTFEVADIWLFLNINMPDTPDWVRQGVAQGKIRINLDTPDRLYLPYIEAKSGMRKQVIVYSGDYLLLAGDNRILKAREEVVRDLYTQKAKEN